MPKASASFYRSEGKFQKDRTTEGQQKQMKRLEKKKILEQLDITTMFTFSLRRHKYALQNDKG